jgi:hypothetical protein
MNPRLCSTTTAGAPAERLAACTASDVHAFFEVYSTLEVDGSRTVIREVTIGDPTSCGPI